MQCHWLRHTQTNPALKHFTQTLTILGGLISTESKPFIWARFTSVTPEEVPLNSACDKADNFTSKFPKPLLYWFLGTTASNQLAGWQTCPPATWCKMSSYWNHLSGHWRKTAAGPTVISVQETQPYVHCTFIPWSFNEWGEADTHYSSTQWQWKKTAYHCFRDRSRSTWFVMQTHVVPWQQHDGGANVATYVWCRLNLALSCCCHWFYYCLLLLLLFLGGGGEMGPDLMTVLSIRLNQFAALYHLLVNCVQCLTHVMHRPQAPRQRLTKPKKKEKLSRLMLGSFPAFLPPHCPGCNICFPTQHLFTHSRTTSENNKHSISLSTSLCVKKGW